MVAIEPTISTYPVLRAEDVSRYADMDPDWGFGGLGYVTYKRTYARPIFATHFNGDLFLDGDGEPLIERTEDWHETVLRVVNGAQKIGADLTGDELHRLYDYIFNLKASVSGRALWQLGTENVDRIGADALVNCWMVDVGKVSDFAWTLERLMLGGGVGFSVDQPERLGVVRPATITHKDGAGSDFIVPDTREGWGELLSRTMHAYLDDDRDTKREFTYSTHIVRGKGKPIKGFGGTSSGPEILVEGLGQICEVMDRAVNRNLTSVDVLDIMTIIGSIVVAGNVRRSAMIALGSLHDRSFVEAKRWDLGNIPNHRAMSNNTVYVNAEQMRNMPEHIWEGYMGNGEPYGFFNLESSQEFGRTGELRPDYTIVGCNPCAEIPLAHRGSCNLAELNMPRISSVDEFKDASVLLYKVQKAIAAMPYLDRVSQDVIRRDMRLGLSVTGVAQSVDKLDWLSPTYEHLREVDAEWSALHGWVESVRLTTVQPSGTKSFVFGVTPGVHPGFSKYFVKRMRMASDDVLIDYCKSRGYTTYPVKNFDGTEDSRTSIVEFPCEFPDGTAFAADMDAIAQMDLVRLLQREWADNAISVTVYYEKKELPAIQEYLAEHWHEMKSVSFLLHDEHGFDQAPMGELTEAEFLEMNSKVQGVGERIYGNTFTDYLGDDCATGACPVR
jgi:ribonucleoside-triphosphate reductase